MFIFKLKHAIIVSLFMSVLLAQNCAPQHMMSNLDSSSLNSQDTPAFLAAKDVLQSKCVKCHSSTGLASFAIFDLSAAQNFVSTGQVIPGKPNESKLIFRLKKTWDEDHVANPTVENMPPTEEISKSDYNVLVNWVLSMVDSSVGPYTCNEQSTIDQRMVASAMKVLSPVQYKNTLDDFLKMVLSTTSANSVLNKSFLNIVFPDVMATTKYPRGQNNIGAIELKNYFQVSDALAKEVVNTTNYNSFVANTINLDIGLCTALNVNSLSPVCQAQFVRNLGKLLFRRPLKEELNDNEVAFFVDDFTTTSLQTAAVGAIVFRMLMSPQFLYMLENNEMPFKDNDNLLKLSSYSIASRLTYQFWNSMPDRFLFELAKNKDLYDETHFLEAVSYVLNHSKAQNFIDEFSIGWFGLNQIPEFDSSSTPFTIPQINLRGVKFNSTLRSAMIREIQDLVAYTWKNNGKIEEILLSDISFARNAELMKIYDLSTPAPLNVTPSNAVRMPATHSGLLTRAGLLAESGGLQNPIHRAIRIMNNVVCLDLPAAPADTMPEIPLTDVAIETMTVRQQFAHNTSTPTCFACHKSINPFGFALSNFNGLGFYQTQEPAMNVMGLPTGSLLPVDSKVTFDTTFGSSVQSQTAVEYSQMLSKRKEFKTCFVNNYSQYFLNRDADKKIEGCRLNKVYQRLQVGQSLNEAFKSLALDPEFRMRKLENN